MRSGYLLAWLGTLMLLATTCQAQPREGGSRGRARSTRGTLFRLLEMSPVRKELELSRLQIEMLDDLQADLGEQRRAVFSSSDPLRIPGDPAGQGGREDSDQAAKNRFDAMREATEKIRAQGEKLVAVILDSNQSKRLQQLRLQDEGTRAFDRQELREQVGVTEAQFEQIKALRRTEDDPSLSRRRRQQKVDEAVLALLDEAQQAKFKELKGKVFEFPLQLPADFRGLRDSPDGSRPGRP